MGLTKAEAEAEAIRRWYQLPPHMRASCEDAQAFATRLDEQLDFWCVTNRARLIGAWLIREFFRAREAEANDEIAAFQEALNDDTLMEVVMPPDPVVEEVADQDAEQAA